MEGINNATRRQIVINFYQKNQAKGKPYTIEYFCKLNVSRQQVYRAIQGCILFRIPPPGGGGELNAR